MRLAFVNPEWRYDGSIYFGCRAPHLPLELGYSAAAARSRGAETLIVDCALDRIDMAEAALRVAAFAPDFTVVTTAPTYLFWRCPPPELRAPLALLRLLAHRGGQTIAIGPHGSASPGAAFAKLGVDIVIRGEPEDLIARIAAGEDVNDEPGFCRPDRTREDRAIARFADSPALAWPQAWIERHDHHHHRFEGAYSGPGAEVEASRGCPYACTFCAKLDARDAYRRRDRALLLAEIDALLAQGVQYLYFIDEIFLPDKSLLADLEARAVQFGIQTRIDLWSPDMLRALGAAGCVSIEAGVESLSSAGRAALQKKCRDDTEALTQRLIMARRFVPFVQANLIRMDGDDADAVAEWRDALQRAGVWANDPVPLFPYPGSPDYRRLFGTPDQFAWERAHEHYLGCFDALSDIQEALPRPLAELEA